MEQIKQRFSRNSPRNSFLTDRQEDVQESLLAEDVDAFRESKHNSTLRLKLSDSANDFPEAVQKETMENGKLAFVCLYFRQTSGWADCLIDMCL